MADRDHAFADKNRLFRAAVCRHRADIVGDRDDFIRIRQVAGEMAGGYQRGIAGVIAEGTESVGDAIADHIENVGEAIADRTRVGRAASLLCWDDIP